MALPYSGGGFDVAVMALVLFFVPDPKKGVAEMLRVTKPGGMVASYTWDIWATAANANPSTAAAVMIGRTFICFPPYLLRRGGSA